MCTLTWRVAEDGGYDLFFNRDERLERAPESPPRAGRTEKGTRYVAPVDGGQGGTWLLLNEHGLTVCVLNFYPRGRVETGRSSRGELPLKCADCAGAAEVGAMARGWQCEEYAPFHLVAVDAGGAGVRLSWDGRDLTQVAAEGFLTSSSFEPERVQAVRARAFAEWGERTAEGLKRFHHGHDARAGAESVLMRRPDAGTRSVCAVRVRAGVREVGYEAVEREGGAARPPVVARL